MDQEENTVEEVIDGGDFLSEVVIHSKKTQLKEGLQAGVSIALGYFPVALTFGLLARTADLSFLEAVLMSLIVYAGAAQYMSLSLIALGTGAVSIILTTFIVNIRHLLMSTALNEKSEEEPVILKLLYSFGITDETFSVAGTKEGTISSSYMFGLNGISYASWVVFTGVGYIIGTSLPKTLQESMAIALYAMFIGLLVPSMKGNMKVVYLAALAALFHTIFSFTQMETGWAIVLATLLSAFIIEIIEEIKIRWLRGKADE